MVRSSVDFQQLVATSNMRNKAVEEEGEGLASGPDATGARALCDKTRHYKEPQYHSDCQARSKKEGTIADD
jgi:hypothetical protein